MRRSVEDSMAMLAGAGVGIGLMYLLDPDKGAGRRERLTDAARGKLDVVKDLAQTAMAGAANAASATSSIAGSAMSGVSDAVSGSSAGGWLDSIRSKLHSIQDQLRSGGAHAVDTVKEHASTMADDAIATKRDLVNRASLAIGRDRDHHYATQTMCALGSLALGAGLLWAFDPRLGRSRRAWLRDKSNHHLNEFGTFFRRTGRHVGNRMKGQVAVARRSIREMQSSAAPSAGQTTTTTQQPISTAM